MRTMRRIMNAVASAAVCALALSGCAREAMEKDPGAVRFGFTASPTTTRTQFERDVTPSGQGITSEHVYWKSGDAVTVCSDVAANAAGTSHSAVYTASVSSDSQTEVPATSADGLRWQNDGTHKFFAVYGSGAGITMEKVTGSMPATQSLVWNTEKTVGKAPMEYGFMVSTKESVKSDVVELEFNQIYTAFQFTVSSGDNDAVSLTGFTLSSTSTALAGGFEVEYGIPTPTAITRSLDADSKSVTVSFPRSGNVDFQVVKDAPVTFTVLALGQSLTNLTIEFTGPEIGTRKLDLKRNDGSFITFTPGTKHIINGLSFPNLLEVTGPDIIWEQTAIGEDIAWLDDSYVLGVRDPYDLTYKGGSSETGGVISYRIVEGNPVAAEWTVVGYYDTREAAENAPSDDPDHTSYPTWINSYPATGVGAASTSGQSVLINYFASTPSSTEKTITAEEINDEIASSTFGLGSSPECYFNLANPDNKLSDEIIESANSYIVNGPGYYRIPMVMGNGVKANKLNTQAYTKIDGADADNFVNHADLVVNNPFLQKSNGNYTLSNAYVVWESTNGLIETTGTAYSIPNVSSNSPFTMTAGTGDLAGNDIYWLNFHVAKGEQGNAVIAITDGTNVLWSYHIWVTNYVCRNEVAHEDVTVMLNPNRATFATYEGKKDKSYTLMPLNLGWMYEGENIIATEYASNAMYVKILQAGSNKTTVMEVKRPGHHVVTQYGMGNAPYYQWGRKDPFMPVAVAAGGRNKEFSNTANGASGVTLGTAIKNPDQFYSNTNATIAWFKDAPAANLWCADINKTFDPSTGSAQSNDEARNHPVVKTIYDPCPAGYSVPTYGAFSFRTDDRTEGHLPTYSNSTGVWTAPSSVICDSYKNKYAQQAGFYGYGNWNMETYATVLGIKDGYAPDSFYGFRFYANTQVEYAKPNSNWSYTVPSAITVSSPYIFLPALGYRTYHSGILQYRDTSLPYSAPAGSDGRRGYYWAALENDNSQGLSFDIEHYWTENKQSHYINVKNWSHFPLADGCSIRPMQNDN